MALDYFEPFINEAEAYQSFDFLEEWLAFVQKLSNLFRSYSPEDDDEDAIVAILFPNDGKAVNYFIQFAKFQNRIYWDDRALRKVVKNAISKCVRDRLRFSHECKGTSRVVLSQDWGSVLLVAQWQYVYAFPSFLSSHCLYHVGNAFYLLLGHCDYWSMHPL